MPAFISGYRTTTYTLNNPGTQNPATVTQFGTINVNSTAANTSGILGTNGFPWTLTNNGTVQSVGNLGIGVNFQAGGSISNVPVVGTAGLTGGTIRGTGNAVQITGAAGTVTNSGTISQIGPALANGVLLGSGGTVTNTGTISSAGISSSAINLGNSGPGRVVNGASGSPVGLISGYGSGVLAGLGAAPSTISNYGTIKGTGSASNAMTLQSGLVTNTGLITATAAGINFQSALGISDTVTNSGTISATTGVNNSFTIIFAVGGSVSNSGAITNAGLASSSTAINVGNGPGNIVNNQTGLISAVGAAIVTGTIGGPTNITNYGTIISTAAFPAISLRAGGTIINGTSPGAGALITGNGILIGGAAGTISNFGTISSTLSGGAGVNISSGNVTNNGLISGSTTGVSVSGSGATVVNNGTIQGTASGAAGVRLNAGGSLNNSGVITSLASGAGTVNGSGVFLASGGTLSNSGTISNPGANNGNGVQIGTGGGYINNSGLITAYHDGVGFFNSGTLRLVNSGTIRSTGTSPVGVSGFNDWGVISGNGGGPMTVTNFGLIAGSQAAGGGGVLLQNGGTVINQAGAAINGAGGNAISGGTAGPAITVVNSGTVQNSSTTNSMVYLGHGGSVTNNAGALMSANGSTNAVSSVAGGNVTNAGMIFAAGANGVRLAGAVGTVVNAGTIQSNSASACGVYVLAGGAVSNSGLIQGANEGVHFVNQAGTVVNSGSIVSTTTGTSGRAVFLSAGGTVANYGLISGSRIPTVTNGVTGYAAPVEISNAAGLVVNFGSIATTNTANGVNILAGGTLVNGSTTVTGATISASHTGVYVGGKLNVPYPNAPGFITNYGSIISTGRTGISLASGGAVTNRGLITGYRNGVSFTNAAGTIANFGSIAHTGGGTVGSAVYLGAGGVVTNYGMISGARPGAPLPTGYPGALQANNQSVFVTNLGTIANLDNGNGVNLLAGGTLINGSSSNTSATIFAPRGGVYIGGSSGTPMLGAVGYVTNYGAIINTGSATSAIRMVSGGTVTNHGIVASGRTGISFANAAGAVDNFGAIVSTAATSFTAGSGVYLQNGGQITNEAGAYISAIRSAVSLGGTSTTSADVLVTNSGVLTGDVGIKIGLGDTANNTIVNFGAIIGTSGTAIDLGNDAASIVLEPGSQLQGGIANFHAGDSIDLPTVGAFSLNYVNGTLTLFNQTTPVAQLAISTPYVNPQFSEAPDGSGGTIVTVTPPGGPVMFDFIYRYNGNGDYYYGKVADDGSFGYQVGQQVATGAGSYTIFNEEPGAVGVPAGSVFITYLSHAGLGETSTTPLKFAGGQPAGTNGLGSESDSVIGTDGQPHPFGSGAPPSFPLNQLFGFIFSYPDGSSFYTGTVADDGSFGYGAIADGSGVKQIFDSSGKFEGYYSIYREGPTAEPAGKVVINRYFSGQTGQGYDVDQNQSSGSNGLGSETGVIVVNGQQVTFGDPPEAVLSATNPALAVPAIDAADPAIATAQIYQQILGRAPDGGGLALFAAALAQGASVADVQSMIAHSPEAQHDINLMFQQVLGREVDSSGLADYQNALAGGASLGNLRALLGQSPEAQNDLNQLYRQVLGRDGDNGGLGSYTSVVANGGSLADARSILAHSGEAQNDLNLIYQQVLGRDGDSGGLGNYQNALAMGWSLDGVRSDMAHSQEAQSDLARLFNSALGRDPSAAELAGAESRLAQGAALDGLGRDLAASGSAGGFAAIAAGSGDATLAAGAGPTSVLLDNAGFGNDTILGFDPSQDAILLSRAQAPDFPSVLANASPSGSGTLIALGPAHSILLNGVPLSSLHPNNFQFV